MARNASRFRPLQIPIYAFTNNAHVQPQLTLQWGTDPFLIEFDAEDPAANGELATKVLKEKGLVQSDDYLVIVTDQRIRGALVETIQMRIVE